MSLKSTLVTHLKPTRVAHYLHGIALAQPLQDYPRDIADTPEKIIAITETIRDWVFTIFMVVAVIGIIYAAFMYLTAAGDQQRVSKARTALVYSIVAIVVALVAGSVPALVENLLRNTGNSEGIDCVPPGPC